MLASSLPEHELVLALDVQIPPTLPRQTTLLQIEHLLVIHIQKSLLAVDFEE